jgi:endonuclease/exonuclease/phosphatase (EEP) superfamily protein YafD
VTREATRSLHQRLRGIERLLTEVASPGQPVVVVGDFNSTPQSEKSGQTRRRLPALWDRLVPRAANFCAIHEGLKNLWRITRAQGSK